MGVFEVIVWRVEWWVEAAWRKLARVPHSVEAVREKRSLSTSYLFQRRNRETGNAGDHCTRSKKTGEARYAERARKAAGMTPTCLSKCAKAGEYMGICAGNMERWQRKPRRLTYSYWRQCSRGGSWMRQRLLLLKVGGRGQNGRGKLPL